MSSKFGSTALVLFLAAHASAQHLTFGVVGGTSITSDFETGTYISPGGIADNGPNAGQTVSTSVTNTSGDRGLIVGPKLELRLPWNMSLEVDALHRALHSITAFTTFYSGGSQTSYAPFQISHASWEIPVLAKYRFARAPLHPFFEAGPSLRPAGSGANVSHTGITTGAVHSGSCDNKPHLGKLRSHDESSSRRCRRRGFRLGKLPPDQVVDKHSLAAGQ